MTDDMIKAVMFMFNCEVPACIYSIIKVFGSPPNYLYFHDTLL